MVDGVAASTLDWWAEAGVDVLVDDLPRNWLAPPPPAAAAPAAGADAAAFAGRAVPTVPAPAAAPAPVELPTDLAQFRRWLLTDPTLPGPAAARIDAAGDPTAGTVIVVDMPEAEDRAAGALLSGEIGALFDRMLAAITLGRDTIYLVPLSPARPSAGRLREADLARLTPLLLHHLALARPKRLLLLGDGPAQALLRLPAARAREAVHQIDIGGTPIAAVASLAPRLVHTQREYRAAAWADLQRFMTL
jgi:DNA polymerase